MKPPRRLEAPPRLRFYVTVWVLLIWALAPPVSDLSRWLHEGERWVWGAVESLELQDVPPLRALMTLAEEEDAGAPPSAEPSTPPVVVAGP